MIDKKNKTILVTGATGRQGGAVVESLLKGKWGVKAFTRGSSKESVQRLRNLGAEIITGDMGERNSLDMAMKGVYGVFAVTAYIERGTAMEISFGKNLADAAEHNGVEHFIFSSAAGSDQNTGIPQFESKKSIEKYIADNGLNATIFRPVFFMDNFNAAGLFRSIIMGGVLRLPVRRDKILQMIAADDIGIFVRTAFESPEKYMGKSIDIAGDEMTMPKAAEIFTARIGCKTEYDEIPVKSVTDKRKEDGMMFDWLNNSDFTVDIKSLHSIHPDIMSLDLWLYRHGWSKSCIMKAA